MKHGCYFLASLDGAPLADRDLAVMGFDRSALFLPDAALMVSDIDNAAVHVRKRDDGIDAFLGYLDEPEALAATLKQDGRTSPLELASMGLERFGDLASVEIAGQWTLLRWHAPSRALTLLTSERRRDTHYLASDGVRVAIAPEMRRLGKLDWVDGGFDERGFLLGLGRAPLRRGLGDATPMRGVTSCREGTRVEVRAHDTRTTKAQPLVALPPRQLSFDDAIEEIEALLRRMMRQHLQRYPRTAIMLSGGLDSSVLAWLASVERDAAEDIVFLTSAAPPGSGLLDETPYARMVAQHLGIRLVPVTHARDSNAYRPSEKMLDALESPNLSARHYLDEAFFDAAVSNGTCSLIDGICGELTITNYAEFMLHPPTRRTSARAYAHAFRNWLATMKPVQQFPNNAFHVRLSPSMLGRLPKDFSHIWGDGHEGPRSLRPDEAFGIETGANKLWAAPIATPYPDLASQSFFVDPRLLRLVGSMPATIMERHGQVRAPARAILRGRLPELVYQRPLNLPFSPSHHLLMRENAQTALARLPAFRKAKLDSILNLDWLTTNLRLAQAPKPLTIELQFELQLTALTAEFLMHRGETK